MTWLVAIGLTNAAIASVLACVAWGLGRCFRRPALTRLLWIIVLCKLLAPPLAKAPTWLAVPNRWLAESAPDTPAGESATRDAPDHEAVWANVLQPDSPIPVTMLPGTDSLGVERAGGLAAAPGGFSKPRQVAGETGLGFARLSAADCVRGVAVIWICGSAFYLVWLAHRSWRFRQFLSRASRHDAALSRRVSRLAREAGLRSAPRSFVVESAVSPMLWGLGRRARLLFPAGLARRIDADACDALLLHELAHYARGDWLVRVLELAVQVVYWWHPLIWWARREIEAAEEECCDAWAVGQQSGSRRAYAEALLETLDFLCEPVGSLPPAACGLGSAPLLRSRLTQIMCGNVALHPSRPAKAIVLAGAAIVLPWGPAFVGPSRPEAAAEALRPQPRTETLVGIGPIQPAVAEEVDAAPSQVPPAVDEPRSGSWFIAHNPLPPGPALYATAISPNGKHKLEARAGHRATLIDVESGGHLDLSSYRILSASFSPDSRRLVTAQEDDNVVRLWDANSGELLARLTGCDLAVQAVAFAPDGRRVAAGALDGSVLVWELNDKEQVARLPQQNTPVSCLRWSQGGDRLAISLSNWSNRDSSSLVIWRPDEGGEQIWSFEHSIGAVEWATSQEVLVADWSGSARSVDLTTGLVVETQWLSKDAISAAAFSPDCPLLPRWQARRLARIDE